MGVTLGTVDNGWVVPYSSILSKIFNVHINEACSSVRAIKYIKNGSDQAIFNFRNKEVANPVDELKTYGHYDSSNVWRLLGLPTRKEPNH